MIIITPRNWYRKNAQFSNRMTGHYSPESTISHLQGMLIISLHLGANSRQRLMLATAANRAIALC